MGKRASPTTSRKMQVQAAQDAVKVHPWPKEAGRKTNKSWAIYVKNQSHRAFEDWNPSDLVELARTSQIQEVAMSQAALLRKEGLTYETEKGPRPNPRVAALASLNGTIVANMRRMGCTHNTAVKGDRRAADNRAKAEQEAAQGLDVPDLRDVNTDGHALM